MASRGYVICTISRLHNYNAQSQDSENAQRNLKIARNIYISEILSCMRIIRHVISTSVCPTGYVPVMNPAVPITTSDSITVSWPAPSASQLVENYILEYTLGQITARRKRQAESFNVTVTAPTTSYTLRNNIRPFTRYTFRVFSDFGNGLVSLTVDTFTAETEEARTLLHNSVISCAYSLHVAVFVSWFTG